MFLRTALVLILSAGCTLGELSPVTDTAISEDNGGGGGGGGGGGSGSDTGATYDPFAGLAGDPGCEDFEGTPIPGATGFFVGDLGRSGDNIQGDEAWVLFANAAWEQATTPGSDCSLVWNVSGDVLPPETCVGCTHELVINAAFNQTTSDCLAGLEAAEGVDFATRYFVQALSDGSATFSFESGTVFATGILTDNRIAYVTDGRCYFF